MTASDDRRREVLAGAASALTAEVGRLNEQLKESSKRLDALAKRNVALGSRSRTHSWWILGTAAGLLLDVILTFVLFVFFDRQQETSARLERSIGESCAFYALILGSYRPESRPEGPARAEYEASFVRMRRSYDVLECVDPIVPPAIPPPR